MLSRRAIISRGTSLDSLSNELLILILKGLPVRPLRRMAAVSKKFQILCIAILYDTVNLSVPDHHAWGSREIEKLYKKVALRQWHFVQQILKKPTYGHHVRSLTWTMELHQNGILPVVNGRDLASIWSRDELFEAFSHMINAKYLDIGFDGPPRTLTPIRRPLFPRATSIRLKGKMHWTFTSAVLHGPGKASLEALALDNILECGVDHGVPVQGFTWDIEENWPEGTSPISVEPGCMRRVVTAELLCRCKHRLRWLYLRKQGHQHRNQDPWFKQDQGIYEEWAALIQVGQPRELTLEHGGWDRPEYGGKDPSWRRGPLPVLSPQDMAPMDRRFEHTILPVLQAGWESLERLVIKGVSSRVTENLTLKGVEVVTIEKVESCRETIVP